MKIFLTGGTGFIGSHFLRQGLAAGHEILALRRPGSKPRISLENEPEWLEVAFDKLEPEHFARCEAVVHLAAHSANVPYDSLENCLHWNVTMPLRMADRALKAGIKRFIVAGSCFEYGKSGERYEFIPVDAPLEPTQSYPISKAAASVAWAGFARDTNVEVSILRIFQVYGQGEPEGRLWPSIRAAAISGSDYMMTAGEQVRDFVPVNDVAQKFIESINHRQETPCKIFNIGTGKPRSVADFARDIWYQNKATGKLCIGALPYRNNEIMRFVPVVTPL
jgi:nucleoside-diphosphate-sugar epimerase